MPITLLPGAENGQSMSVVPYSQEEGAGKSRAEGCKGLGGDEGAGVTLSIEKV